MEIIDSYKWRYATKKFDPLKKISTNDIDLLKESIRLAPTSYGLQLYKVLIIENEFLKNKLMKASYGQSQIADASHLFVFCNFTCVFEKDIDTYIGLKAKSENIEVGEIKGYNDFLKSTLLKKNKEEISIWTTNQLYIALANLLTTCATLRIDSCPMEGIESSLYNEILDLNPRSMNAAVVAAVGYRSKEDLSQNEKKVRKPSELLFEYK